MNGRRLWAGIAALLLLFGSFAVASAETDYVDLSERFGDVATLEWNGQTYYERDRVSTVLAVCFNPTASGAGAPELVLLIVIDNGGKTVTPLQIDPSLRVNWEIEADEAGRIPQGATLAEMFASSADAKDGCALIMYALNGLFPMEAIEQSIALDLDGLTVIDGLENDGVNTVGDALMERLHAVKAIVEQSGDPTDLVSALGDYIHTEMKSGALMTIVDKVDRYEVHPRTPAPVLEADEGAEIDRDAFTELMVNLYFDDAPMW